MEYEHQKFVVVVLLLLMSLFDVLVSQKCTSLIILDKLFVRIFLIASLL